MNSVTDLFTNRTQIAYASNPRLIHGGERGYPNGGSAKRYADDINALLWGTCGSDIMIWCFAVLAK